MRFKTRLLPIIAGAVAGGLIAWAVASGGTNSTTTTTVLQSTGSSGLPTSLTTQQGLSVNQIYRNDGPGVVDITVISQSNGSGSLGGAFGGQRTEGEGAGVVYDKNGDILTDEHVVAGAIKVTVTFENGLKVPARVLGTDPSTDVAAIHVNVPASELHPIPFANSGTAQVGDPVVAIGSPFSLPETVTNGIISATGRSITAPNNFTITGAIQTDAPINPGNSGGPLLDGNGHVVGLADQIETNNTTATGEGSSSGVGFAIPSNMVARIANLIIAGKKVQHAFVGVFLNPSSVGGAEISPQNGVQANTPASRAGLKPGDLVTSVNGQTISSTQQFIETVDMYSPGQTVTMTVKRGSQTLHFRVTLGTRPSAAPSTGG
jgi:S1-C subfamily serine protease